MFCGWIKYELKIYKILCKFVLINFVIYEIYMMRNIKLNLCVRYNNYIINKRFNYINYYDNMLFSGWFKIVIFVVFVLLFFDFEKVYNYVKLIIKGYDCNV